MSQLTEGQPLMLLPEPSNLKDPNAMAVCTLKGRQLGSVFREQNLKLQFGLGFGKVWSIGKNEAGLWGARASTYEQFSLSLCVYVCVCVCMCVYLCVRLCKFVCLCLYQNVRKSVHECECVSACTNVCTCVRGIVFTMQEHQRALRVYQHL